MRSLRRNKDVANDAVTIDASRPDIESEPPGSAADDDMDAGEEWFDLDELEADRLDQDSTGHAPTTDEPGIQRHSLRRNASALMGSQVITWILTLVLTTYVARVLGPGGLGQLGIANAVWHIAAVFVAWGASNLITVELARDHTRTDLVNRAVALQTIVYVMAWPVVLGFSFVAGYNSSVMLTIVIVGGSVMFTTLSLDARAAFYGFEQMTPSSVVDIVARVVTTALTVIVLMSGGRTQASAVLITVTAIFHAVLVAHRLRRKTGCTLRPQYSDLRAIGRAGLPFLLIEATMIVYHQADTLVMSVLVDRDELGYYGAASQLFGTLLFIPTVLMTTVFPTFARLNATDPEALVHLTRRAIRFLVLAGMPVGFGTVALANPICTLIFGREFEPAGDVLAVYGCVTVVIFPLILLGQYAVATGKQTRWALFLVLGIVLTVPLDLLFLPVARALFGHSAAGGALSYIVTETIILVLACTTIAKHLLDRSIFRRAAICLLIAGAMLAAIWPLRGLLLPIPVVAGVIVYCALIAVFRVLDDEESELVGALFRRALGPFGRR